MQTERVTFLTSAEQKAALDAYASSSGKSMGHLLREASSRYLVEADMGEEEQLGLLIQELSEALPKIHASIDRAISTLNKTHEEIALMRREAGFPK